MKVEIETETLVAFVDATKNCTSDTMARMNNLCLAALAAAGLGPDGKESPLTVGGTRVFYDSTERQFRYTISVADYGVPIGPIVPLRHLLATTPAELAALEREVKEQTDAEKNRRMQNTFSIPINLAPEVASPASVLKEQ